MKWVRGLTRQGTECFIEVRGEDLMHGMLLTGSPVGATDLQSLKTTQEVTLAKILAPVSPPNILCIGLNYKPHADETKSQLPERPLLFLKATTSVIAHGDSIEIPDSSHEIDYEVELAVVIGAKAKKVSVDDALNYVHGYTIANDVTARDWQKKLDKQWAKGKGFDTFCPLGPVVVTKDEIPDPQNLSISTEVSGEILQDSNTSEMIFSVAYLISYLSESMTLLPGTVILTGTPEGVGVARTPQRFLCNGDVVTMHIGGVGELRNGVV